MSVIYRLAEKFKSKKSVKRIGLGGFQVEDDTEDDLIETIKSEVSVVSTTSLETEESVSYSDNIGGFSDMISLELNFEDGSYLPLVATINYIAYDDSGTTQKGKLEVVFSGYNITYVNEYFNNINEDLIPEFSLAIENEKLIVRVKFTKYNQPYSVFVKTIVDVIRSNKIAKVTAEYYDSNSIGTDLL